MAQTAIDLAADLGQHPDKMRDVAAGIVDVGLEQHGIARGLVELNAIAVGENALELRAVESGGATDQRHSRRVEAELVFPQAAQSHHPVGARRQVVNEATFAILRRHHVVGAENTEVFRDQGIGGNRLTDGERDLHRVFDQAVTFQLHLAARHVEAADQLLIGAR